MRKIYFLLAALFMLMPFNLLSQDGNPDTSFGGNGTVQTDLSNGGSDLAFSIAQAPDGKLLVAGGIDIGDFIFHPAIVQYNSNGELTQSFGNDGILSRDYGSGFDFYTHVGAQTDGKVIAGGSIGQFGNKDVILSRYLPNGNLDSSFGNNGDLIVFDGNIESSVFKLLDDDSFLIANPINNGSTTVIHLKKHLPDGTLDVSFGDSGTVLVENGEQSDAIFFMELMANGNIVIAARIQWSGSYLNSLMRLLPDGSKDTSFGTNGAAIITQFPDYTLQSLALYDDGQIALLQNLYTANPDTFHTRITRYTANGSFDGSFGAGQGFIDPDIVNLAAQTLIVQPNQRLLLYGELTDFFEGGGNTFIRRYFNNGSIDSTLNVSTVLNSEYFAEEMILQDDGKIVCMGVSAWYNGPEDFVIERYNNTPLSVTDIESGSLIAFPNPTQNKVTITYNLVENSIAPFQINDVSGKVLMEGNLTGNEATIDLSRLQSGLYFLNSANTTLRLIKE